VPLSISAFCVIILSCADGRADAEVEDHPAVGGERLGRFPDAPALNGHGENHGQRHNPPTAAQLVLEPVEMILKPRGAHGTILGQGGGGFVHARLI
jgi:hypothetical protein